MGDRHGDRLVEVGLDRELGGLEFEDLSGRVLAALEEAPSSQFHPADVPVVEDCGHRWRPLLLVASVLLPLGLIYGFLLVREEVREPEPAVTETGDCEAGDSETGAEGDTQGKAKLVRVAGRCIDGAGRPLPRVAVDLYRMDYRADRARLVGHALTEKDGRFAFAGVNDVSSADTGWVFYYVLARAKGRAMGYASFQDAQHWPTREQLELRLGAPRSVSGTVVDARGRPVAGVRVWLRGINLSDDSGTNRLYLLAPDVRLQGTTDAKGRYTVAGLPVGQKLWFGTSHPKFSDANAACDADLKSFDIELEAAAWATGRVLLPNGKPAAFVKVEAQGVRMSDFGRTTTDGEGHYRLPPLRADHYNVWAKRKGHTVVALAGVHLLPGKVARLDELRLIRGGFIVGRVVDARTGKGVKPGATGDVGLYGPSRPRAGAAIEVGQIRADGSFEIRVAPGSNYVYVRCGEGWSSAGPANHTVVVKSGERVEVTFRVAPGGGRRPR